MFTTCHLVIIALCLGITNSYEPIKIFKRRIVLNVLSSANVQEQPATAGTVRRFMLLRHGETDLNSLGVIQGSSDASRLTANGRKQAQDAGRLIARLLKESTVLPDSPLAAVFASNLTRALETTAELKRVWDDEGVSHREDLSSSSTYKGVLSCLREVDLHEWCVTPKCQLNIFSTSNDQGRKEQKRTCSFISRRVGRVGP